MEKKTKSPSGGARFCQALGYGLLGLLLAPLYDTSRIFKYWYENWYAEMFAKGDGQSCPSYPISNACCGILLNIIKLVWNIATIIVVALIAVAFLILLPLSLLGGLIAGCVYGWQQAHERGPEHSRVSTFWNSEKLYFPSAWIAVKAFCVYVVCACCLDHQPQNSHSRKSSPQKRQPSTHHDKQGGRTKHHRKRSSRQSSNKAGRASVTLQPPLEPSTDTSDSASRYDESKPHKPQRGRGSNSQSRSASADSRRRRRRRSHASRRSSHSAERCRGDGHRSTHLHVPGIMKTVAARRTDAGTPVELEHSLSKNEEKPINELQPTASKQRSRSVTFDLEPQSDKRKRRSDSLAMAAGEEAFQKSTPAAKGHQPSRSARSTDRHHKRSRRSQRPSSKSAEPIPLTIPQQAPVSRACQFGVVNGNQKNADHSASTDEGMCCTM